MLGHRPQSTNQPLRETLPFLLPTRLLVHTLTLPPRTHCTWLTRFVCSSLSSPRCKNSVSCLWHTTNISSMNGQCKVLHYSRYSVFINVISGHTLSCGSYNRTPIRIDLNVACILLTKADLPSLPHQSACTPHTSLFISSERKILRFQLYSTCYGFIRLCFLNP